MDKLKTLLAKEWTREVQADGNVFAARITELPGCFSQGSSREEALENLQDALEIWLQAAIDSGSI